MVIDLRSDTVTQPTPEMRRAMSLAEVGDDVFGEDPTVRRLEERAAALVGKEAALFVPSGTMGNQVALKSWTRPGQLLICEERSHVIKFEMGATAVISGLTPATIPSEDGSFTAKDVEDRIPPPVYYLQSPGVVVVETTHNMAGGTVFPLERLREVYSYCRNRGIPVHMDGARVFNAAAALGVPVTKITQFADSVMFCLSKGLACPVGSLLCGPADFIEEARKVRKMLGGGMRQVGVLAAAGLVALDTMIERLGEDHQRARRLAEGLNALKGLHVDLEKVQSNIIMVDFDDSMDARVWAEAMQKERILTIALGPRRVRLVTHYHITDADVVRMLDVASKLIKV